MKRGTIGIGLSFASAFALVGQSARAQSTGSQDTEKPAEPYVDRLIDEGGLAVDTQRTEEEAPANTNGNARSLVVELGGSRIEPRTRLTGGVLSNSDQPQQEIGLSVSARYQTDNFGRIVIDGAIRHGTRVGTFGSASRNSTSASITVTSQNLPLGNGWTADSGFGLASTRNIPLLAKQQRFYLPTSPIYGGSVILRSYDRLTGLGGVAVPEPRATLNLSIGEPGLLGGTRLGDFTGLSGIAATVGAQTRLTSEISAGFQAIDVRRSRDPYKSIQTDDTSGAADARFSSRGVIATASMDMAGVRLQATGIWSKTSSDSVLTGAQGNSTDALGGAMDIGFRKGRTSLTGGLYYFQPDLAWGTAVIANNAYGGYARISASSQRWRFTLNTDVVAPVDGGGPKGVLVNGDIRRQFDFDVSAGINSTLRVANGATSSQMLGFVDFSSRFGGSRIEFGWAHDTQSDLYRIGWNQHWSLPTWLPSGSRLSTQFAFDHTITSSEADATDAKSRARAKRFNAAITAGASPFNGITFDLALAYSTDASKSSSSVYGPIDSTGGILGVLSSQSGQAFSAMLTATARLSPRWSMSASITDTRSNLYSRNGLTGPFSSPIGYNASQLAEIQSSTFRLKAGYLTLRYSMAAGREPAILGRPQFPYSGTGALEGHIYLDANDNRQRDAGEKGVAGGIVVLDGILAVRTDELGYYRFDDVAEGPHRVALNADALPLPWSIEPSELTSSNGSYVKDVDVDVRATTRLDVAAIRE